MTHEQAHSKYVLKCASASFSKRLVSQTLVKNAVNLMQHKIIVNWQINCIWCNRGLRFCIC